MINILQVGLTATYGGTESAVRNQFAALNHNRVQYWFVNENADLKTAFTDEFVAGGSQIFDLPGRRMHPIRHYLGWGKLLGFLRNEIDGIVFNSNSYKFILPLVISALFGVKVRIFHSHIAGDPSGKPESAPRKCIHRICAALVRAFCTDLFACSEKAAGWMFGKGVPYIMINNSIESSKYAITSASTQNNGLVIGMVGNFIYQKNHAFAIELFQHILAKAPESRLLLAGVAPVNGDSSYLDNVKSTVKQFGLEDSVELLGRVTDIPGLMKRLDCLIMPSFFEGLPMVGLEAQASGLACYFSDRVTREVQVNENCKFLSIDNGVDKWVEAILNQPKVDRVALSRHFAESKFNIKNSIEDLMAFYERKAGKR